MTPQPAISVDDRCPSCSAAVPVDPRFVTWCPECDWNADPMAEPPVTPTSWRARRAARRWERHVATERAAAERLYAESLRETNPYRRRDGFWPVTMAVAGMVHLITAAMAVGSGWLLATGPLPIKAVGVVGLVAAFFSLPRPYRVRPDEWSLSRAEAPHLYGLADRIAAELKVAPVGAIKVFGGFGAHYGRFGFRRRGVLFIGLPMWEVLTPQERVAMLGHELGHAVRGDIRRCLLLVSASETAERWHEFTNPKELIVTDSDLYTMVGHALAAALLFVPHLFARLLLFLLLLSVRRVSQRAEYRADALASRVASPAAVRVLLETMVLEESATALLRRQAIAYQAARAFRTGFDPEDGAALWRELRECVASVPESERLRQLRVSALRPPSEFSFYPPVLLRVRLAGERGVERGSVDFPEREVAAVEAELTVVRDRMAQAVLTVEL